IKPLYLVQTAQCLALASEIKQLLGLPGLDRRMNIARVHDFLLSGISDHTAETMFNGVMQVRAGECLLVDTGKAPLAVTIRRWYPATVADIDVDEAEAGRRYREGLQDAVKLPLRADLTGGSCLSGGLASSSIVCRMSDMRRSRSGGARVNTFSACYAEKSVDEKPFMEEVVGHASTIPHYLYPKSDDVFRRASDITWHQDEPFGSTSIFAQWCVCDEARRAGIKVMLDGQGADEPLAGYHGSFSYYMAELIRRRDVAMVVRTMAERKRYHGLAVRDQLQTYIAPLLPLA